MACDGPQHHRKKVSAGGVSLVWLVAAAVFFYSITA
jgi:hypothetical protein